MIEYLNHELISYNFSKIKETNYDNCSNVAFICQKCNCIIFKYSGEYEYKKEGNNFYWMYDKGIDNIYFAERKWKKITLTCEEEQIKNLLE